MDGILNFLPVLAHLLIGFFFLFFGFWNLYHWSPTVSLMEQKHIPFPSVVLALGIFTQMVCAVLIILGLYVKLAALILIVFTIVVVHIFHSFWQMEGEARQLNFVIYLTHMTSTNGALVLLLNTIEPNYSFWAITNI